MPRIQIRPNAGNEMGKTEDMKRMIKKNDEKQARLHHWETTGQAHAGRSDRRRGTSLRSAQDDRKTAQDA
jgi:hypothetical protein